MKNVMYYETELDLYKIDFDPVKEEYHCMFKMKDTQKVAKKTVSTYKKALDLVWEIMETYLDNNTITAH